MTNICGYDIFGYHSREGGAIVEPVYEKLDKNIKGLELETDDLWSNEELVGEAIRDGLIITKDNIEMAKRDYNVIASYDQTVDVEFIFQANQQRNLIKKLKEFNHYGIKPYNFCNGTETSCHIHNNLQYIENNGGTMVGMQRASEFLLPILYEISGRDGNGYGWASSRFEEGYCNVPFQTLLSTAKNADKIDDVDSSHSTVCNAEHSNTAEIRIFSNGCGFDVDLIKTYIEFTDHIIDMACFMEDKSYVNEFDSLIDWTSDFINGTRRRRNSLKLFDLEEKLLHKQDLEFMDFNKKWNDIYDDFEFIERNNQTRSIERQVRTILRFVRNNELRHDIQLRFDIPCYTYKVDLDSIRKALNQIYLNERENL